MELSPLALVYPSEVPLFRDPTPEGRMHLRFRRYDLLLAAWVGLAGLAGRVPPAVAAGSETGFLAMNDAAMDKMMADMAISPTGDIDRDFVAMMVPHHQAAIAMVQAELLYGRNQTLLRIAQQIVVEQQQEIAAMRLAVGEAASPTWVAEAAKTPPGAPASDRAANIGLEAPYLHATVAAVDRMMADMTPKPTADVDNDFVAMMEPHHQGAIDMAKAELRYGRNQPLKAIAQEIIIDQTQEIALMRLAVKAPLPQPQSSPTAIPGDAGSVAPAETFGAAQTRMRMGPGIPMAPMSPAGSH
jgi:uncharacterized protein (DUF305 family)